LIRSQSYFVRVAETMGNHKIVVYPLSFKWENNKLIMTRIVIKGSITELTIRHIDFEQPLIPKKALIDKNGLYRLLPQNGVIAEIGVGVGENAYSLLASGRPKKLFLIDCWEYQDPKVYADDFNVAQVGQDERYYSVIQKFKDDNRVEVLKMYSKEAAKKFADNYFDWIYLDSNHGYEAAKEDLALWYPKVKNGGFIVGHDYIVFPDFGVLRAVNEFITEHGLALEFLTTKDKFESWAVRKPD